MPMEEDEIASWCPEQEAQLMAGASQTDSGLSTNPFDAELLLETLAQRGFADRLVILLKGLCAKAGDESSLPPYHPKSRRISWTCNPSVLHASDTPALEIYPHGKYLLIYGKIAICL
jgi:hypothetical protein